MFNLKNFFSNLIPSQTRISTENNQKNNVSNGWMDQNAKNDKNVIEVSEVIDGVENNGNKNKFFGVKSYFNYFYLSPTSDYCTANVGNLHDNTFKSGIWYLLPPPPSQRRAYYIIYSLCRIIATLGFLLLFIGAGSIVIGYSWPMLHSAILHLKNNDESNENNFDTSMLRIAIDQDEEGNFYIPPERLAEFLKDPMHLWKTFGFCAFSIGICIMTISFLITSSACYSIANNKFATVFTSNQDKNAPSNEPPVRIYPRSGAVSPPTKFQIVPTKNAQPNRISPTNGPIPVIEEISKVQPKNLKKSSNTSTTAPTADDLLINNEVNDTKPLLLK